MVLYWYQLVLELVLVLVLPYCMYVQYVQYILLARVSNAI